MILHYINPWTAGNAWVCTLHCATDTLVLKHQGISIHSDDQISVVLGQFHTQIYNEQDQNKINNEKMTHFVKG